MITVACVLRSGGHYTRGYVNALHSGVAQHMPRDYPWTFTCLTDLKIEGAVKLKHKWPGWWSKLELFRPGVFPKDQKVLYFDLDTLIVGSLLPFTLYGGSFAMLADFYREYRPRGRPRFGESGMMIWTPGANTERIYEAFAADPKLWMGQFRGDGRMIREHVKHEYLQDLYPGLICSYKIHARHGPPKGARVVCGHGVPHFNEPKTGWAHKLWRSRQ